MARSADPLTYAAVVAWGYFPGIMNGVLRPDDSVVREIQDALRIAERSGNDRALAFARLVLGIALVHRHTAAERDGGTRAPGRGQRRVPARWTQPGRTATTPPIATIGDRYRAMATSLGFEGHMQWAEEMP